MDRLRLMSTVVLFLCISNGAPFEFWNAAERNVSLPNNFLIDKEHKILIVAAKNSVCHVSLNLQNQSNVRDLQPESSAYLACTDDLRLEDECQNYNHVLTLPSGQGSINTTQGIMPINNTVLVCGSNAFNPICHYRERGTLIELKEESGTMFCPYNQNGGSTSLWLSTGSLVSAAPADPDSPRFGISISDSPFGGTVRVTTKPDDSEWINKAPHFVSMYEIGEHVYMFFSEEAVEACGDTVVYSRVARVCKDDLGSMDISSRSRIPVYLTYIKARISCTSSSGLTNDVAYHFNNIQDTFYLPASLADDGAEHLYAVFTSPKNGPVGSTVCYYTFYSDDNPQDIGNVFSGDYTVLQDGGWTTHANYDDFTCETGDRTVDHARLYQIMSKPVTQKNQLPLLEMSGSTFHRIVVDQVQDLNGTYREVMFVAAHQNGELVVLKSAVGGSGSEQHISQTVTLGTDSDITQMNLYGTGKDAYVYIGTNMGIYRVSGPNCEHYTDCCSCVAARDPYCAFDTSTHKCTAIGDHNRNDPNLIQDVVGGDSGQCLTGMNGETTETPVPESSTTTTQPTMCPSTNVENTESTTTTSTDDTDATPKGTTEKKDDSDHKTTKEPAQSPGPVGGLGTAAPSTQNDITWPIVGAVSGFIGGVVIGIIIMALFYNRRNFIFFGRKTERMYTIDPENEGGKSSSAKRRKSSGGASNSYSKEEEALKNNSGNFTASGTQPNDYTMVTPHVKVNDTHRHMNGHARKCSSPSPAIPTIPDPKSLNKPVNVPTPTPPTYTQHRPSTGSLSCEATSPYRGMVSQQQTDPNLKSNFKQVEHITNQQRAVYGRNILARSPSIDAKHSVVNGYRSNGRTLPYKVSYSTDQDIVSISGAEVSCSQC